jgi:hypothetical protein
MVATLSRPGAELYWPQPPTRLRGRTSACRLKPAEFTPSAGAGHLRPLPYRSSFVQRIGRIKPSPGTTNSDGEVVRLRTYRETCRGGLKPAPYAPPDLCAASREGPSDTRGVPHRFISADHGDVSDVARVVGIKI